MTSDELNREISEICDDNSLYEAFGGKSIPYIGWFWRKVNFDSDYCWFGIGNDDPDGLYIGFMENNKWDYPEVKCDGEKWQKIKQLLESAVIAPSTESLKAVHDEIKTLIDIDKWIKQEVWIERY